MPLPPLAPLWVLLPTPLVPLPLPLWALPPAPLPTQPKLLPALPATKFFQPGRVAERSPDSGLDT